MNEKLPYYMAYPMPFSFDDERIERMDLEYLKSMYPKIPKRIPFTLNPALSADTSSPPMRPYGIRKQYGVRRIS